MRTTYLSSMRLYPDRPDVLTVGSWTYCLPGAKVMPYPHAFGSQIWDPKGVEGDPPVGEVRGMLGRTPGTSDPRATGRHFCGTRAAWLGGIPYADRPGLELDAEGIPLCCHVPRTETLTLALEIRESGPPTSLNLALALADVEDVEMQGLRLAFALEETPPPALTLALSLEELRDVDVQAAALALSLGEAADVTVEALRLGLLLEWTPPPATVPIACGACTEGPVTWRLVVAGFGGDSAVLNGTWPIAYSGAGCAWDSLAGADPTMTAFWAVMYTGLAGWVLRGRYDPLNVIADYVPAAAWSCTGPTNLMAFSSGNNVAGAPSTLTLAFP